MARKKAEEQDAAAGRAAKSAEAPKAKKAAKKATPAKKVAPAEKVVSAKKVAPAKKAAAAKKAAPVEQADQPAKVGAQKGKPAEKKERPEKKQAVAKAAALKGATQKEVTQQEVAAKEAPPRLKAKYNDQVASALQKEFSYPSRMAVPKIAMIKINVGMGEATQNSRLLDAAVVELGAIAGQKPIVTRARKSIAAFKVREGMPIGCAVTLRGNRMYEFLDRLISIALPRVRDFRGISTKAFDGRGNYTLGLKEHVIFPEIDYSKVDHTKGMNVTLVTTATNDRESLSLLRHMGMPFAD